MTDYLITLHYAFKMRTVLGFHLLLGLIVAHLQCGVVVNEWGFKFIDSDPVDTALLTVKLDPVKVDHCRENGQLNITLRDAKIGDEVINCITENCQRKYTN